MAHRFARVSSSQPTARSEHILYLGSTLAILAIVTIVVSMLVRERNNAGQAATQVAANIVKLIDTDVLRNVQLYDVALTSMSAVIQSPDFAQAPPATRQRLLFNPIITASFRGDLLWVDGQGRIVADSLAEPPRQTDFSHWPSFVAHREQKDAGLLISQPFLDPLGTLGWCVSFTRRLSGVDGSFQGVASGALRLSYFNDLFKSLDMGADSTVTLLSTNGVVLARQPQDANTQVIGQSFARQPNFQRIIEQPNGHFSARSATTGLDRLYTYSQVGQLPLIVVVALATDEVYAAWQRTAVLVACATSLLCMGMIAMTLLMGRELRRRRRAESRLADLAATDGLTGLANRRSLDIALQNEWARAMRAGQELSVLMIDVDHFRALNERHGHQGGDEALRNVAKAIQRCVRRPSDLVARYGGEEFMVILAQTDVVAAQALAENIRAAVNALPPFAGSSALTVSVGLASKRVLPGKTLQSLMAAADAALYQAKHNGRNRVEAATS